MPNERHLLDEIIADERLTSLFQPIVDVARRDIHGYEALIRGPSGTLLHAPQRLFEAAMQAGRLVELDLLCRRIAIERFVALGLEGKLFLNVMPATLLERDFREGLTLGFLERAGLAPERVVIELTEHAPILDYQAMRQAVRHYRDMGFRVALDDLGRATPACATGPSSGPISSSWTAILFPASTPGRTSANFCAPCWTWHAAWAAN